MYAFLTRNESKSLHDKKPPRMYKKRTGNCRGGYQPPARENPGFREMSGESAPRPTWFHSTEHSETTTWRASVASPTIRCTIFGAQSNICHATVGEAIDARQVSVPECLVEWKNVGHRYEFAQRDCLLRACTAREDDILPYIGWVVIWRCCFFGAKRPWLSLWESWLPRKGQTERVPRSNTRFQSSNGVPSQSACSADSSPKGRAKVASLHTIFGVLSERCLFRYLHYSLFTIHSPLSTLHSPLSTLLQAANIRYNIPQQLT